MGEAGAVEGRITFFVHEANRTADGWAVRGEIGLGPIVVGDEFAFIHHQDDGAEELVRLRVSRQEQTELGLTGGRDATVRSGDILGGEVER